MRDPARGRPHGAHAGPGRFARQHALGILTIKDLIEAPPLARRASCAKLVSVPAAHCGRTFKLHLYESSLEATITSRW